MASVPRSLGSTIELVVNSFEPNPGSEKTMRMSVCRLYVFLSVSALGVVAAPVTAWAQYRPGAVTEPAVGEQYHIEASYAWWNAEPELIVNSESLGILGTDVNLVTDLGVEKKRLGKFDLVFKPARSTGCGSSACRSSTKPTPSRCRGNSCSTASATRSACR